jgi:peptide/nickel transport system permease protein
MQQTSRRLVRFLWVVLTVSAATFVMTDVLPGDAAYTIAGPEATARDIDAIRESLGLDRNPLIRYGQWLSRVARGDLGESLLNHQPVLDTILSRLPVTLELMVLSQLLALGLAIPLGVVCAYKERSALDRALSTVAFGIMSVPVFVMGLALIYGFAIQLRWLPATGYTPLAYGLWPNLRSILLPAVCLAMVEWVPLMRVLRSDMIATLQQDYILMAKSKGLPTGHILFRHALRPSSLSLITLMGIQIGHLIGGSMIVETLFALPGIGRLVVGAIYSRDTALIQGCVLVITIGYVGANAAVDALYAILDPRVRSGAAGGR